MISDRQSQSESTSDKIERELSLVGEGLNGFGDAARIAFTNHKTETLIEAGGSVAVGIGLAAVRSLPRIGAPVAVAISAGLFCATIKNVAETGTEALGAFTDNWSGAENWQENKAIVRRDLGQFAFDSAVMAGAAGLGSGLMRGFGPAAFRPAGAVASGQMPLPFSVGDTPRALPPLPETIAPAHTLSADLGTLSPSKMYESSRVSTREAYRRNDGAADSHWMAQSLTGSSFPSVKGTIDVDIAVVGGGTGSILAADLAAKGYRVANVDAGRIAGGNTTLSGMAGIGTRYLDEASTVTASELGTSKTKRIMDISKNGQSWLQDRARQVGAFRPATSYSVSPDLADLQSEARLVTKIDTDAHFLRADRINGSIPNAAGAIAISNEGLIDPVRLAVQSIARELSRPGTGLQVFEHSPVLSISGSSHFYVGRNQPLMS